MTGSPPQTPSSRTTCGCSVLTALGMAILFDRRIPTHGHIALKAFACNADCRTSADTAAVWVGPAQEFQRVPGLCQNIYGPLPDHIHEGRRAP